MFQGTGGFGSSTSSPFGGTQYKPATSVFNSGPMFGSTGSTSLFGSNTTQPSTGLFGSTTTPAFGQTQQQPNTFGAVTGFTATSNTGTGLFGAQQNANTGGLFNSSSTPFGQNKPAFGGFGTTNQSTGLFGQQATTAQPNQQLFGQTQQSTGLFGASTGFGAGQPGTGGTTIKFAPITGNDTMVKNGVSTQISTRHHCITCMKEYESKSLEELRFEDYAANRKGPQQGGQAGGLFGAPAQSQPLFGTQTSTPSTGLFGATTDNKSVFGQPSTGFGAPNQNLFGGSSMFNKPAGTVAPFGTTATSSTATSGFGFGSTNTSNNLFGQQTTQSSGFFGNTSQPSAFGTQSSGFAPFGQTQQQQGGLFNQNKPAFSLNTSQPSGFNFGSTATTSNTLTPSFSTNKTTTPFGQQSAFGSTASTSGGFGQSPFGQTQNQANSSFFSNSFNKPTSGAFSFNTTNTTNTLGTGLNFNSNSSLFGQNQNKPGGLFNSGGTTNMFGSMNTFGTGSAFNTGTTGLGTSFSLNSNQQNNSLLPSFGQNTSAPQNNALNQYMLALASMPFGDSPLFKNLVPSTSKSEEGIKPTSPAAMKALQSGINYRVQSDSSSKVKIIKPNSMARNLFDGLDDDEEELSSSLPGTPGLDTTGRLKDHGRNVRRLYIKPRPFNPDMSLAQSFNDNNNDSIYNNNATSPQPQDQTFTSLIKKNILFQPEQQLNDNDARTSERLASPLAKMHETTINNSRLLENSGGSLETSVIEDPLRRRTSDLHNLKRLEINKMNLSNVSGQPRPHVQSDSKDQPEHSTSTSSSGDSSAEECLGQEPHPTGIVLTRSGYYTIPNLSDLTQLIDSEGRCIVDNFTVGRLNYGNVFYPDSFDVSNLNLDKIVHFRHKEVVIYPDDGEKPPLGTGLNRRAQVTLDRVWPTDRQTRQPITDSARLEIMDFENKLRQASAKHGTRFIEYRPQTGSWVFKVDHFSKYGLTDSDEEEGGGSAVTDAKKGLVKYPALPSKEQQLLATKAQDPAALAPTAIRESQKYNARKQMIEDGMEIGMDVQLDPLSDHIFLEDEDEEMADGPFDLYEMEGILSPTSKLSRQLGTSAHKLQLMKASFFEPDLHLGDDFEHGDDMFHSSNMETTGTVDKSKLTSLGMGDLFHASHLNLRPKLQYDAKPPSLIQRHLTPDDKLDESEEEVGLEMEGASSRPCFYPVDNLVTHLDHSDTSIIKGLEGYLADQAIARGLAFRPSWGPTNILTTLNSPFFINTMSLTSIDKQNFKDSIVEQLEGALKCSMIRRESGFPLALCTDGVEALTKHLSIARKHSNDDMLNTFALCHALWGHLSDTGSDDSNYSVSLSRRQAMSHWLETVTSSLAKTDMDMMSDKSPSSVFSLMTCHNIIDACKTAISIGDKRLSLVLSQAGSSRVVRGLIDRQLTEWRDTEADQLIDVNRIKLYMLSAGRMIHQTSQRQLSTCQQLDWIRSFALHLWYGCYSTSSISEALHDYDAAWSSENSYAPPPLPNHFTDEDACTSDEQPLSVLYHLMKLFSDRSHPLDVLLNPNTYTSNPLDYRLSWLLMRVLMSLGYSHLSEYNICLIHTSFASQLEQYGLWHWSVFVLLHIDSNQREKLICDTIERNIINETDDVKENFLLDKLHIPVAWIASAKATTNIVNNNYEEAARNLILAGNWNYAHEIIMKHIASKSLVNCKDNSYKLMDELLNELEKEDRYRDILGWDTGGLIIVEYIRAVKLIQQLRSNNEVDEVLQDLTQMAQRIYHRIKLLPKTTPIDRLCQTELSERLLSILPEIPLDPGFLGDSVPGAALIESNWQPWEKSS